MSAEGAEVMLKFSRYCSGTAKQYQLNYEKIQEISAYQFLRRKYRKMGIVCQESLPIQTLVLEKVTFTSFQPPTAFSPND